MRLIYQIISFSVFFLITSIFLVRLLLSVYVSEMACCVLQKTLSISLLQSNMEIMYILNFIQSCLIMLLAASVWHLFSQTETVMLIVYMYTER